MPFRFSGKGLGQLDTRRVRVTTPCSSRGPERWGCLLCFQWPVQRGSIGPELGDLSLAARLERHRNLSLMSWLGVLMVNWKWQGIQGWAACTKVTHPTFKIALLKMSCSLECSQPSQLPGSLFCLLQVSAPFPREAVPITLFETHLPSHPWTGLLIPLLHLFFSTAFIASWCAICSPCWLEYYLLPSTEL